MNTEPSYEAAEFGRVALHVLRDAGGDELAPAGARDRQRASRQVAAALGEIGAWQIDPRADAVELEAAAAICRSAGYWAAPYPVAARLACPPGLAADALAVVPGGLADGLPDALAAAIAPDGHGLRWAAADLHGQYRPLSADASPEQGAPGFFPSDDGAGVVALGLVLPCWTLLGLLDRAIELTTAHVLTREQFGRRLAAFQGVTFQLTDAEVERAGTEELAKYALWSVQERRPELLADALALRLAAIEAADVVFRVAHQLHGAIGFCDESPLSWLSRASEPLRRLPFGRSGTLDQLTRTAGSGGLAGIFARTEAGGHAARIGPVATVPGQQAPLKASEPSL